MSDTVERTEAVDLGPEEGELIEVADESPEEGL